MSKFSNSKMFQRLDSFAKKVNKSKSSSSTDSKKAAHSSSSSSHTTNDSNNTSSSDGTTYYDHDDLDMNLLIGPNKANKTAKEIIDELDPRYFTADFDPIPELLSSLPQQSSQHADQELEFKLNELDVVKLCIDKRLSNQVFANYHHFVDGLSLIGDIKDNLFETSLLCTDGRSRLLAISNQLTVSIFNTLQYSQRMARLLLIQYHLLDIYYLLRQEKEISVYLQQGEFLNAVSIYQSCFNKLSQSNMYHFSCLDDVRKRYVHSADAINLRAKEQFITMCKKFDAILTKNIIESMITLRETKQIMDILRKNYPLLIDDLSISSLLPYLNHDLIANREDINPAEIKHKRMKDIASLLDMTRFGACYLTITSNFTDCLSSCFRMYEYFQSLCQIDDHNNNSNNSNTSITHNDNNHSSDSNHYNIDSNNNDDGSPSHSNTSNKMSPISSVKRDLIAARDFLNVYRQEIWTSISQHMITLLSSVYLTTQTIHIDDFLRILHAGYAFVNIGEHFTATHSDHFRNMLNRKAQEYIKVFARDSFDHTRNAIEKDDWKVIKAAPTLQMTDLIELKPKIFTKKDIKEINKESASNNMNHIEETKELTDSEDSSLSNGLSRSQDLSLNSYETDDSEANYLYESFLKGENPFRLMLQEQLQAYDQRYQEKRLEKEKGKHYRILQTSIISPSSASSSSTVSTSRLLAAPAIQNSLHKASLLQRSNPPLYPDPAIILTSSSYTTVQYMGRYICIMEDIKPLASEALVHLMELFDFYVYSIFCLFGLNQPNFFTEYYDKYPTLKKTLLNVKTKVEQGNFGAGVFNSFALKRAAEGYDMASPSANAGAASAPSTPSAASLLSPASAGGSASSSSSGFGPSSSGSASKEGKSLLGKLNKQLNTAISSAANVANTAANTVTNIATNTRLNASSLQQQQHQQQQQREQREREESKRSHPILVSLNDSIDLEDERHLYGVMQRCIATESIAFLVNIFKDNQHRMISLLRPSEINKLKSFISNIQQVQQEFESYMYQNLAPLILPADVFAPKITHGSWLLNEAATKPSPYVSSILTILRAHDLAIKAHGGLPFIITQKLYDETLRWLTDQLVEAYATVKKCNLEGRKLMLLDSNSLQEGLAKINIPFSHNSLIEQRWLYVNDYIQAYYLTADEWIEWVQLHSHYSLSVIVSCIQVGCGSLMEKKEQKELLLNVSREWQRIQEEKESQKENKEIAERKE